MQHPTLGIKYFTGTLHASNTAKKKLIDCFKATKSRPKQILLASNKIELLLTVDKDQGSRFCFFAFLLITSFCLRFRPHVCWLLRKREAFVLPQEPKYVFPLQISVISLHLFNRGSVIYRQTEFLSSLLNNIKSMAFKIFRSPGLIPSQFISTHEPSTTDRRSFINMCITKTANTITTECIRYYAFYNVHWYSIQWVNKHLMNLAVPLRPCRLLIAKLNLGLYSIRELVGKEHIYVYLYVEKYCV